ncbi:DUF3014 domain-containing protein [Thalassomonas actiniarum]|uniref:DUF3014 domain-containing protein n=1 Tax=Thalassomonas actiniarum TaxID=485447 RepID=A0AAF0C2C3_9GAMM|nr:DUF3014 domain-containing protein [Thalassomonas actiniarum]WDD97614.1 DUF3014 domain-containing protein [Thalassomonas actiniarum]
MDNLDQTQTQSPKVSPLLVAGGLIIATIGGVVGWQYFREKPPAVPEQVQVQPAPAPVIEPEVIEPEVEILPEPELAETEQIQAPEHEVELVEVEALPTLDESDLWLQEKLPTMTWRKELLKLVIDDDMIRRFVVFTDNFAQGVLAYEHSPFVRPVTSFSAKETKTFDNKHQQVWEWDENSVRRFSLYVDLLRSMESERLVDWYMELKPLINEAYSELGYPDEDFTHTLQDAITRVLDMEIPKETMEVIRPSVMFRYKDPEIEAMDDADKLLLRLGKENLLVIKSVLLELNEKLARAESNS